MATTDVKRYGLAVALSALLAACASNDDGSSSGGGGGGGGGAGGGGGGSNPTFSAPAEASFGNNATPRVFAADAGDNLEKLVADQTAVPMFQTAVTVSEDGSIAPDDSVNTAGATLAVSSVGPGDEGVTAFDITIPALSIDATATFEDGDDLADDFVADLGDGRTLELHTSNSDLDYTAFGTWVVTGAEGVAGGTGGAFTVGSETPDDAVPGGSATFSGQTFGIYVSAETGAETSSYVLGDVSLDANFDTGSFGGSFTNMVAIDEADAQSTFDGLGFKGSITGARFAGTVEVISDQSGFLRSDAAGVIDGGFYGPAAQETSGVWSAQDGAGNTVIGGFSGAAN